MATQYFSRSSNFSTQALYDSIKCNAIFRIRTLMKEGVDIDARNYKGYTPLLFACLLQRERIVELLIKSGANVDCSDEKKCTVLHYATRFGWTDIVRLLAKKVSDLDASNIRGETAMHRVSKSRHLNIVKCLVEEGADINRENIVGFTPLICAAASSQKSTFDLLLEYGAKFDGNELLLLYYATLNRWKNVVWFLVKEIPNLKKKYVLADTNLDPRSSEGHLNIVKLFLGEGTDFNSRNEKISRPVLFSAISLGHLEVVKWLVKKVPDLNESDHRSNTGLHHASNDGDLGIVRCLVEEGADVNRRDDTGATALFRASRNIEVMKYLVEQGADINIMDGTGATALVRASASGHLEGVKYLVKQGADVNVKSIYGDTSLLSAAFNRQKDIVDLLMNLGADVNCSNGSKWSMLHLASFYGWTDLIQPLVKRGCNPDARVVFGHTALFFACINKKLDTAQSLLLAGASWDIVDIDGISLITYLTKQQQPQFEFIKLFIETGAYLNNVEYNTLVKSSLLKVLKDVELCCQAIVNKYNNHELPALYNLAASGILPRIEQMKIKTGSQVIRAIEETVRSEIYTKGHCNILKVRPMALSALSVGSVLEHYRQKTFKLKNWTKRPATFNSVNNCQHPNKLMRLS